MAKRHVDLGFAEKCDDYWRLLSHYFPSKLGGPPAWLSLTCVPGFDQLKCIGCEQTCKFLLQIYSPSPLDSGESALRSGFVDSKPEDDAFHRTLYVFVCAERSCVKRSFLCFRSQLPQINEFYSSSPPDENFFDESAAYPKVSDFIKVCQVCHCSSSKSCAKCRSVSYCSKNHQAIDWRTGHKADCSAEPDGLCNNIPHPSALVNVLCNYI